MSNTKSIPEIRVKGIYTGEVKSVFKDKVFQKGSVQMQKWTIEFTDGQSFENILPFGHSCPFKAGQVCTYRVEYITAFGTEISYVYPTSDSENKFTPIYIPVDLRGSPLQIALDIAVKSQSIESGVERVLEEAEKVLEWINKKINVERST